METGAEQLKDWIGRRGYGQAETAAQLGISPAFISMILKGHRKPGRTLAVKIQQLAGVPVASWGATRDDKSPTPVSGVTANVQLGTTTLKSKPRLSESYYQRCGIPKPEPRRKVKAREDRTEAAVIREQRQQTVDRDGYCRLYYGDAGLRAFVWGLFGECSGPSEWSHYNETHRRSKTVGQAPEQRHDSAHSLMLCDYHANEYDTNRMRIKETTSAGCDGQLRFSRSGGEAWEEPE